MATERTAEVPHFRETPTVSLNAKGAEAPRVRPSFEPQAFLGNYRLLREAGRGAMGVVYEAEHQSLGRRVALKVLPPHFARDAETLDRFRREARSAASLHHTNIVPVFEVGAEGDAVYYAMQFIDGRTAEQWVEREVAAPTPIEARCRFIAQVGRQVADGLGFAHARGIVHRDIKPSNLLLDDAGRVWIADFGLAKTVEDGLTEAGSILGTLPYMAPERFSNRGDARADLYALGLTLYEMATLHRAFDAEDRLQLMEQIHKGDPPRPSVRARGFPRDLETILLKAIDKDPKRRYATGEEFSEDLRRFLEDEPILARRIRPLERTWRWAKRHPATATLAGLAIWLTVILAVGSTLAALKFRDMAREADEKSLAALSSEQKALAAQQRASQEAAAAAEISSFLVSLFDESDPLGLEGRAFPSKKLPKDAIDTRKFLDRGSERLKTLLLDQPLPRAELLDKVGTVYIGFAEFDRALPLLEESLKLRLAHLPEDHPDVATSWHHRGYYHHTRANFAKATEDYRKALAIRKKCFGPDHPLVGQTLLHLGTTHNDMTPPQVLDGWLTESLRIHRLHYGADSRETMIPHLALLMHRLYCNRMDSAMLMLPETLQLLEKHGPRADFGEAIRGYVDGQLMMGLGRYKDSARMLESSVRKAEPILGETHFLVLMARGGWAEVLHEKLRDYDAAERVYQEQIERFGRVYGADSAEAGGNHLLLARVLRDAQRSDEAEKELHSAAAAFRKHGRGDLARALHILGGLELRRGDLESAEGRLIESAALRKAGPDDGRKWQGMATWEAHTLLKKRGAADRALELLREHLPTLAAAKADKDDSQVTAFLFAELAMNLKTRGAAASEVERACNEAVRMLETAVSLGFRNAALLDASPSLDVLRERPDYQAVRAKLTPAKKLS
ncbi:MAG: serine/threonine-protein kinase [Gemmataceae bacterium]|nr:serine/threonine-protein kinase [Gemmataceae bacterium]